MEYILNNQKYPIKIVKKNNKNTYIRVRDGVIYVTTNYFTFQNEIKRLIAKNEDTIIKMLIKSNKEQNKKNKFYYLGKELDIKVIETNDVFIKDTTIYTPSITTLEKWYKQELIHIFKSRLDYCYSLFKEDIPYPKLKIRTMKSRWGVCNRKDMSITLNTNLMQFGINEIDYVIVHELAHFVHFDHSKNFWIVVSKYAPKYKEIRKVMKS